MLRNIFTVSGTDLQRLGSLQAVEFFRALLWAEARRLKIPPNHVHVSSSVNVADGGVDASVNASSLPAESGLIVTSRTCYQIKASEAFLPQQASHIKKELFGEKKAVFKDNLGESVRDCLDNGGAYVLVCFKQDLVDPQRRKAEGHIRKYLTECGYKNPKVEVWSQNNILGFLQPFPSLMLKLSGRDHLAFQSHRSWAEQDDMRRELQAGEEQTQLIANTQEELRRDNEAVHLHLWGEPGVGKTKLVLEATRADDLEPLVIYCSAASFIDSDLINDLLMPDSAFSAILVIDECSAENRTLIWNRFKHAGARIKIITIYNE